MSCFNLLVSCVIFLPVNFIDVLLHLGGSRVVEIVYSLIRYLLSYTLATCTFLYIYESMVFVSM